MLSVGLESGFVLPQKFRLVTVTFLSSMAVGAGLSWAGIAIPMVATCIVISVVVFISLMLAERQHNLYSAYPLCLFRGGHGADHRVFWPHLLRNFRSGHLRQLFNIPFWRAGYWSEVLHEIRWYLFMTKEPQKYIGQNLLTQCAVLFIITLGGSFTIVSGLAHYTGGAQAGSLTHDLFGCVHGLTWNSQRLHTLHHLGMWWIMIFMIIRIYVAIREDIMSRQSIVSIVISGHSTLKNDRND